MKKYQWIEFLLTAMTIFFVCQSGFAATTSTQSISSKADVMTAAPAAPAIDTATSAPATTTMSSALPDPVGRVVWVKGELSAEMPNKEIRHLQKTSLIYVHDTLSTDSNTQAQVVFTDNTLMTFRPSTKFYIDQYSYQRSKKKGSVGKYIMNLIEGGFRTITGLIPKANPPDYQVNTPVATIGVRGTDYAVYVKDGEIYVGFYSGSPCVHNKKGNMCLDAAHPYARATTDSAPVPVSQQPAVFKEKLEIVPATIAPFVGPGGGSGDGSTSSGGTVSSFCIQ